MKKTTFLLIAICLTLNVLAESFTVNGITYKITSSSSPYTVKVNNGEYSGIITIPASVTYNDITYSVTSIITGAFYNSNTVTSITIPSSIISIEDYAFAACMQLTTFHVNNPLPANITLGTGIFNFTPTTYLYVPIGTKSLYAAASQWSGFIDIIEENTNTSVESILHNAVSVSLNRHKIQLTGLGTDALIQVTGIDGKIVFSQKSSTQTMEIAIPQTGVYIINVGNEKYKVLIQ